MPKEKYDPPDPRRMYTIMSSEEAANGKKSHWAELEISGKRLRNGPELWTHCKLRVSYVVRTGLDKKSGVELPTLKWASIPT